jgi:hypothetical protein
VSLGDGRRSMTRGARRDGLDEQKPRSISARDRLGPHASGERGAQGRERLVDARDDLGRGANREGRGLAAAGGCKTV